MPAYRVQIDRSLCSSFGICEALAPDLFALGPDGLVSLLAAATDDEVVLEAAKSCPVGAIAVSLAREES